MINFETIKESKEMYEMCIYYIKFRIRMMILNS